MIASATGDTSAGSSPVTNRCKFDIGPSNASVNQEVHGRKRHILVDTLGLLLAVVVTAANVDDARAAQKLFAQVRGRDFPRLRHLGRKRQILHRIESDGESLAIEGFLSAAGEKVGGEGAMALVNVANLNEVCASLSPEAAASLMAAIGTNLKTMEGGVAARVSATGFGVVAESSDAAGELADRIQNPARARGE